MLGPSVSSSDSMIGITVGFTIGLLILHGIESFIEKCINLTETFITVPSTADTVSIPITKSPETPRKKTDILFNDTSKELNLELLSIYGNRIGVDGKK